MTPDDEPLAAGAFGEWLSTTAAALAGQADADVPCDRCTACCESSQFVHIGADERETLAAIPRALLVPAPGRPRGNYIMGYDQDGRCPMLTDGVCSIYDRRPRACRSYDCRVFAAAGLDPTEDGKPLIAQRVKRWRFDHPEATDDELHAAVVAAARADDPTLPAIARAVAAVGVVIRDRD